MQSINLEKNQMSPANAAINAALDEAEAEFERGESVTLEQSQKNARDRHQAGQENPQTAIPA